MKPKEEEKILKRYPELYRQYYLPMTESCMMWGFAHGSGWRKIIEKMSKRLHAYAESKAINLEVEQVKEKFGTLRVYTNFDADPEVTKITSEAEAASARTCEVCGGVYGAKLRNEGWMKVRCEKCYNKERTTKK